jgi:hypothetical protein
LCLLKERPLANKKIGFYVVASFDRKGQDTIDISGWNHVGIDRRLGIGRTGSLLSVMSRCKLKHLRGPAQSSLTSFVKETIMDNLVRAFCIATVLALPVKASADLSEVPYGKYTLDRSHGYITFTYSHLGFSNPRVGFNSFDTELDLDSSNPENSTVELSIEVELLYR